MNDPFRTRNLIDNLHLRLFETAFRRLGAGDWRARNVQSSFWRFYMNFRDGAALELPDETIPLRAGKLYFVPAGVYFHCRSDAPFEHFYVHFDVIGLPGLALRELFAAPIELSPHPHWQETTYAIAHELADAAPTGTASAVTPDSPLNLRLQCAIKSLLFGSLALYLQSLAPERLEWLQKLTLSHGPVLPALRYIEDNIAEKITNADLARRCHLSEDYFIRRFRECTGQSPLRYVLERRIILAAQRLLFSEQSIEQIALAAGFGNRFYFSRQFVRHTGVSPAAYRKTSRI